MKKQPPATEQSAQLLLPIIVWDVDKVPTLPKIPELACVLLRAAAPATYLRAAVHLIEARPQAPIAANSSWTRAVVVKGNCWWPVGETLPVSRQGAAWQEGE